MQNCVFLTKNLFKLIKGFIYELYVNTWKSYIVAVDLKNWKKKLCYNFQKRVFTWFMSYFDYIMWYILN
jgi:hypothetical protein